MPVKYSGGGSSYSGRGKRRRSKSATRKTRKVGKARKSVKPPEKVPSKVKKTKPTPSRPTVMARVGTVEAILSKIVQASQDRKEVEILYMAKDGKRSRRRVEPYSLRRNNGGLILYGHCLMRDGLRSFSVQYIQEVYVLAKQFNPRHEITLSQDFLSLRNQFRA